MDGFNVSCVSALVLDEDGTGVDTEDYFQTLRDNTVLVVLEKGQKWIPTVQVSIVCYYRGHQTWGQFIIFLFSPPGSLVRPFLKVC